MDLHTQVVSIVEKIVADVQALAARLEGPNATATERVDPRDLERQCRDLGLAVGHELFVRLLEAYGDGKQGTRVRCPCGGLRRWVGARASPARPHEPGPDAGARLVLLSRVWPGVVAPG